MPRTSGAAGHQERSPDHVPGVAGVARVVDEGQREDQRDDGDATSRTNRAGVDPAWWSCQAPLSWASAEKAYGTAAVMPVISTRVVKTVAPLVPR